MYLPVLGSKCPQGTRGCAYSAVLNILFVSFVASNYLLQLATAISLDSAKSEIARAPHPNETLDKEAIGLKYGDAMVVIVVVVELSLNRKTDCKWIRVGGVGGGGLLTHRRMSQ